MARRNVSIEARARIPEETALNLPQTRRSLALAGVLCALLTGASHAQDAKALYTRGLAATCANCHGSEGRAVPGEAMARLAGLEAAYLGEQLRAFRDGKRPATVMHQLAKGYSDEQISAIAAYFAAQK
jgi:cytochrome subunit of sulfide dehydrogenase